MDITVEFILKFDAECIYICANSKNFHNRLVQLQNGHHSGIHIEKLILMIYNMPYIVNISTHFQIRQSIYIRQYPLVHHVMALGHWNITSWDVPNDPRTPQKHTWYIPQIGYYNVPMTPYHGPQH